MNKHHLTAISRKKLPSPTLWILENCNIGRKVLDFGCGKCASINPPNWTNYDPYYVPYQFRPDEKFDTIICNYVLCVLPSVERMPVLRKIQSLLNENGLAYITVRNDKPAQGWGYSKRGTYQGRVHKLPLPILYQNCCFKIFTLSKTTEL